MLFGHGFYSPFGTKTLFVKGSSKTEAFPCSSHWMCWLIPRGTHFSTFKIIFPLPHQGKIPQVAVTFPSQTGHSNVIKTKRVGLSMMIYDRKVCNRDASTVVWSRALWATPVRLRVQHSCEDGGAVKEAMRRGDNKREKVEPGGRGI